MLQDSESSSRLAFIHVPASNNDRDIRVFSNLIFQLMTKGSISDISPKDFLELLDRAFETMPASYEDFFGNGLSHMRHVLQDSDLDFDSEMYSEEYQQFCLKGRLFARGSSVSPGSQYAITNGRVSLNAIETLHDSLSILSVDRSYKAFRF